MAFCDKCGAQLSEGASFCGKCGAPRKKSPSGGRSCWQASGPKLPLVVTVTVAVLGAVAAVVYNLFLR